jgi:acetyl esterase/lipase
MPTRTRRFLAPILTFALAGCSPAGLLSGVNSFLPGDPGARRLASGVSFGALPRQKLDVWGQRHRAGAPLKPVVIFLYGGGWVSGARGDYGFAGSAFAGQGFVTIVPDYRLVPEVRFPAFVQDSALAVRWARDHVAAYGGDPNRITLAGHSAGAYNSLMLSLDPRFLREAGVDPKIVRGAAILSGPTDFYPWTEIRGRDALGQWPKPEETQPINLARADAPPLLLLHGTADTVVRPRNAQVLAARLQSLGAPVTLKLYPGASHVDVVKALSRPFRRSLPVLADASAFLHSVSAAPTSPARK